MDGLNVGVDFSFKLYDPNPEVTLHLGGEKGLQMDNIELVVRSNFGKYVRGDVIADKAEIDAILDGPNQHDVVKRQRAK